MSRVDWKKGRFDTRYEVGQIENSLRAYQGSQIEDSVEYFRFLQAESTMDDIFDEGIGQGLVFRPSVNLPVLHVTHNEGGSTNADTGFYFNDEISVTTSFDLFSRTGMTAADVAHQRFLKDRILYDDLIFRVTSIQILGQVNKRDTIVSIEGTQVKPDELANDPQFAAFAEQPWPKNP